MLGVRVGFFVYKDDDNWYIKDIPGLFDLDFLLEEDSMNLSNLEYSSKVKLWFYTKLGAYFLDELSLENE